MPNSVGTRVQQTATRERIDQGSDTRSHTRDVGMKKRLATNFTMTAATARIAGANGEFANFAVEDPVLLQGGLSNNGGMFRIIGVDGVNSAYVTVDPAPKDEGPIAGVLRTV